MSLCSVANEADVIAAENKDPDISAWIAGWPQVKSTTLIFSSYQLSKRSMATFDVDLSYSAEWFTAFLRYLDLTNDVYLHFRKRSGGALKHSAGPTSKEDVTIDKSDVWIPYFWYLVRLPNSGTLLSWSFRVYIGKQAINNRPRICSNSRSRVKFLSWESTKNSPHRGRHHDARNCRGKLCGIMWRHYSVNFGPRRLDQDLPTVVWISNQVWFCF